MPSPSNTKRAIRDKAWGGAQCQSQSRGPRRAARNFTAWLLSAAEAELCPFRNTCALLITELLCDWKCPSGRSYQTGTSQREARHQEAVCLPACRLPPQLQVTLLEGEGHQNPAHHRDPPLRPNGKHLHPPRLPGWGITASSLDTS